MYILYIYTYMYSRSQKKSTFRLRTVFITVCVFITVAITVRVHYAFLLPFAFCNYRARALCVYIFRCFFTLSPAAWQRIRASGSHHVREPGLSSCAWKWVVMTRACGVRPARHTRHGRRRDRGASACGRVKLAILAVVRVGD